MLKASTALKFDPKQGAQTQTLFIERLTYTFILFSIAIFKALISSTSLTAIAYENRPCVVWGML
ncbi:hypothetical protein VCHA29O37_460004 [Vibrio chagasii]|nr:hypothetical protein VCHA29O37_460004 [Vibrio chagasii]